MTRLSLCALAVALAAGHSLAAPTTVERAMHRFGEMEAFQDTTPEDTTTPTKPSTPETPEQLMESFVKAVQKQLHIQETLLRQLMKDVEDYLKEMSKALNWEDTRSTAFTKINEMMEMISDRMTTAREAVNEVMANSEHMEGETLRGATSKFMKEVRVQDVVVDALWASLRGVQASAWMTGATGAEEKDAFAVANRAAEEFLVRMYHNLRAAGISEEDIVKFVPKTESDVEGDQGRNMGMRSSGWGYGGWGRGYGGWGRGYGGWGRGYGGWGYGGWGRGYGGWGYPSYGYGWGYPSYGYGYGWGHPYYGYGYWRRLGPNTCPNCPPTPVTGMPTEQMMPPVPKTDADVEGELIRNMGMKGRGSYGGWGYGGWGYPHYGYGWGYPHYGYGWGYPHYGYGHWRRLRPSTCPDCPPTPVTGIPTEQIVPPFRAMGEMMMGQGYTTPMMGQGYTTPMMGQGYTTPMMGQGYTTPMMGQGYTTPMMGQGYTTPMMGQGYTTPMISQRYTTPMMGPRYTTPMVGSAMTSEYPTIFEQNMGYPSTRMNAMDITTPFATNYNTPFDSGFMPTTTAYTGGYRNLAPLNEVPMPGAFPETGMRSTPFGFGPTGEMVPF